MQITTQLRGDVALITMDDAKKNAITPQAIADLNAALDRAEADANAVVLAGRPGSFCAGFDLSIMTGGDFDAIRAIAQGGGEFAVRLWSFPKPLVAACTGHAFTRMGMTLTPWALEPLSHRLSKQFWIPSIVQARVYDPDGALEAGFLDEVVEDGQAVGRALAVAAELAELPGKAYAANKLMSRKASIAIARADIARLSVA